MGRHNDQGDLARWSRTKDPLGIAWKQLPDRDSFPEKIFVPIVEEGEQVQPEKAGGLSREELGAVRDRVLSKLKLGKQAPDYKAALKALDLMVRELTE